MKYNGVGFLELLFLLLLGLKLGGVISVSWWIVTMPVWLPFAIGLVLILFVKFVIK